jgi:hypothetical protein
MTNRDTAFVPAAIALAIACAACGGSPGGTAASATPPTTNASPVAQASSCAELVPAYEGLVALLVASEGTRDPAAYGSVYADLAQWWPNVRIIAWLSDALATDEIHALESEVGAWEEVSEVLFFNRADALHEFQVLFADEPDLLAAVEDDPSVLPRSLRVAVPEASIDEVIKRLAAIPGVMRATSAREELLGLARHAVEVAILLSGTGQRLAEIADRASRLLCPWEDIARAADLDGLDPGGVVGEWIIAVAREGLPVAQDGE